MTALSTYRLDIIRPYLHVRIDSIQFGTGSSDLHPLYVSVNGRYIYVPDFQWVSGVYLRRTSASTHRQRTNWPSEAFWRLTTFLGMRRGKFISVFHDSHAVLQSTNTVFQTTHSLRHPSHAQPLFSFDVRPSWHVFSILSFSLVGRRTHLNLCGEKGTLIFWFL